MAMLTVAVRAPGALGSNVISNVVVPVVAGSVVRVGTPVTVKSLA